MFPTEAAESTYTNHVHLLQRNYREHPVEMHPTLVGIGVVRTAERIMGIFSFVIFLSVALVVGIRMENISHLCMFLTYCESDNKVDLMLS